MGQTKHDKIAKTLAEKYNTDYNKGRGPDIKSSRVIEVATHEGDLYLSLK